VTQLGYWLLCLSAIAFAISLAGPADQKDLIAISGTVERIERGSAGRYGGSDKTLLFVRTEDALVQVNADGELRRSGDVNAGDRISALVAYEDLFGRDIAFLYELERGGELLREYEPKAAAANSFAKLFSFLAPLLAVAGVGFCVIGSRR
jgi:hypothetical protein